MAGLSTYQRLFGLIGYPLSHSFSKQYFSEKFRKEGIGDAYYELFPIEEVEALPSVVERYPNLVGLNVTIPYKQAVIPFMDELDSDAEAVGAVNTIKVAGNLLKGYNSDVYGFEQSLLSAFSKMRFRPEKALILGTGGAARAVAYVLDRQGIPYRYVSRKKSGSCLTYREISKAEVDQHQLIINTTPLGMSPNVDTFPPLPYQFAGGDHLFFDLVYNPGMTKFLRLGAERGATIQNGLDMLYAQAERSWQFWQT